MTTALPRRSIRMLVVACGAGIASVCAPGIDLEAQEPWPDSLTGPTAVLAGMVQDRAGEGPVVGARILLRDATDARFIGAVDADDEGVFEFPRVRPGTYRVSFERLGYKALSRDVRLAEGERIELTVSLVPDAVDLEPVVVSATRRTPWFMKEFERRRETAIGSFVTRDDIERRHPQLVSDLFRTMPGMRLVADRTGAQHLLMRGGCVPKLYIDGVAAYERASIDLAIRPVEVEAIEVYSNASVPIEYAHEACGAVLVWSRPPQAVRGRVAWWKPLLVVGGVFGTLSLIR